MKYTHLIITKVNIKWLPQSKNEEWLKDRIKLFNGILRPSLEAQTNKNFKFITLWGYEPVDIIKNEYPIVIKSEKMGPINKEMMPKIIDLIDEENVLTTRIDTDNAIGIDFVQNLQNHVKDIRLPFYYDINKMHMINLITREKRLWNASQTSAFISVMEKKSEYKCIPYINVHTKIGNNINGKKFDDLDALCTIHGENIYMKKELGISIDFDEKLKYNLKM